MGIIKYSVDSHDKIHIPLTIRSAVPYFTEIIDETLIDLDFNLDDLLDEGAITEVEVNDRTNAIGRSFIELRVILGIICSIITAFDGPEAGGLNVSGNCWFEADNPKSIELRNEYKLKRNTAIAEWKERGRNIAVNLDRRFYLAFKSIDNTETNVWEKLWDDIINSIMPNDAENVKPE